MNFTEAELKYLRWLVTETIKLGYPYNSTMALEVRAKLTSQLELPPHKEVHLSTVDGDRVFDEGCPRCVVERKNDEGRE